LINGVYKIAASATQLANYILLHAFYVQLRLPAARAPTKIYIP